MYFDPDGLFTREELLAKIWAERLSPAQRAQCLAEALARGVTHMDLMRGEAARHDATMADPVQREEARLNISPVSRALALNSLGMLGLPPNKD
jgi:hypothetical protein